MLAFQVVAVILISALLIYMLYKGLSPIVAPLFAAILLMLTNGDSIVKQFAAPAPGPADAPPVASYWDGFTSMIAMFFLFFLGASMLGAIYKKTGAAETVADCFFKWFVSKREGRARARAGGIVCVVTCFVCCYGGLDAFCSIFMLLPIIMILAERSNIPRRYVPGLMFGGISSAQLGPGSPLTGNNFGSQFFQVEATAAPVLGIIGMVFVLALIVVFARKNIGIAYDNGERFSFGSYRAPEMHDKNDRPPFILAIIPLVAVFISNTFIHLDLYLCLAVGDAIALVIFMPWFIKASKKKAAEIGGKSLMVTTREVAETITNGAHDGGFAMLIIASGAAFSTFLATTNGCVAIMNWVTELPFPMLITFSLAIVVLTFLSGSPGCMIIAAPVFMPIAAQLGVSNEVLMRVAVFGQSVLDTLPMNGAILIVMAQSGLSLKEGYPAVFKTTVLYMFFGTVLVTALAMIAPGIW